MLARLVVVYHPCDLVHEGLLRRFLNLFFLGEPVATPWSELKWMGLRHPDVLAS